MDSNISSFISSTASSSLTGFPTSASTTDNTTFQSDIVVLTEVQILRKRFNTAQYIICPLLLVVGIVGNILTILTVSDSKFKKLTSRYILCALAISDSILLLTNPFNQHFLLGVLKTDLRALSVTGCKLFFIAYRTSKMSAAWLVVLVAAERFVAVMYPLKVKQIMKKKNIAICIIFVYVFMFSFTGIWTFSSTIVGDRCRSDVVAKDTVHLHKSFVIVAATMYSFVPLAVLLSITPPIIIKLTRQLRVRKMLQSHVFNAIERSAQETNKISIMLIGILVSFFICVMPISLVLIITFWTNEPFFSSTKKEFVILTSVAQVFEQLNHSSNFLIYVLCSRQFRNMFLYKIGCKHRENRQQSSSTGPFTTQTNATEPEITSAFNSVCEMPKFANENITHIG